MCVRAGVCVCVCVYIYISVCVFVSLVVTYFARLHVDWLVA